jgi:hypothetical protein
VAASWSGKLARAHVALGRHELAAQAFAETYARHNEFTAEQLGISSEQYRIGRLELLNSIIAAYNGAQNPAEAKSWQAELDRLKSLDE